MLLAQAIGNLIDNALKYAGEDGSIRVEVASPPDGPVQISVADDGPGIPDDEKPKVSGRFYRGDTSRGTPVSAWPSAWCNPSRRCTAGHWSCRTIIQDCALA